MALLVGSLDQSSTISGMVTDAPAPVTGSVSASLLLPAIALLLLAAAGSAFAAAFYLGHRGRATPPKGAPVSSGAADR